MNPNREIKMKQHVLEILKNFMMGEEGSKFKPKAIEVEMIGEPKEMDMDDEALEESAADKYADKMHAAEAGMSEKDWEGSEADEEADEEMEGKKGKMSLKDFLASRSE